MMPNTFNTDSYIQRTPVYNTTRDNSQSSPVKPNNNGVFLNLVELKQEIPAQTLNTKRVVIMGFPHADSVFNTTEDRLGQCWTLSPENSDHIAQKELTIQPYGANDFLPASLFVKASGPNDKDCKMLAFDGKITKDSIEFDISAQWADINRLIT